MREYEVPSANIRITFARYGILRANRSTRCAPFKFDSLVRRQAQPPAAHRTSTNSGSTGH